MADSPVRGRATELENKLEYEIHVSRAPLRDYGISRSGVGGLGDSAEVSGVNRGALIAGNLAANSENVIRQIVEIAAIENVEDLPSELNLQVLGNPRLFDQRHI